MPARRRTSASRHTRPPASPRPSRLAAPRSLVRALLLAVLTASRSSAAAAPAAAAAAAGLLTRAALLAQALVPRLPANGLGSRHHKGGHGRVAVVGGSAEYTGAPYYAAASALRAGVDLAWVVSSPAAAAVIKGYSPELIVQPLLAAASEADAPAAAARVLAALERAHAVVIGPGLGRFPPTIALVAALVPALVAADTPLVLDGDALWALATTPALLRAVQGARNVLLTPNAAEFRRLADALGLASPDFGARAHAAAGVRAATGAAAAAAEAEAPASGDEGEDDTDFTAVFGASRLSAALGGVAVVRKGRRDAVAATRDDAWTLDSNLSRAVRARDGSTDRAAGALPPGVAIAGPAVGSPRRSGGQGDVLAGAAGAFLAWARASGAWADTAVVPAAGDGGSGGGGGGGGAGRGSGAAGSERRLAGDVEWHGRPAPGGGANASAAGAGAASPRPAPGAPLPHLWSPAGAAALRPSRDALRVAAGYGAAAVARVAAERAFGKCGRGMTTPDVLLEIAIAIEGGSAGSGRAAVRAAAARRAAAAGDAEAGDEEWAADDAALEGEGEDDAGAGAGDVDAADAELLAMREQGGFPAVPVDAP